MAETGYPFLVEESLGKQWYFTLSDQHKIQYACRENGAWTEAVPIDGESVKFFRAAIDRRDRIYLLAYTLTKQLIYYEWDGNQWYQRMLYRITSRFENISYLEVLSSAARIHLLYYIENSLKRAQESFVHSYFEDGRWKSDVLMNFLTDQIVVPQLSCSDEKGNLYCIYTKTLRNQAHCYLVRFDTRNSIWSKPAVLFQKPVKCSSFNGFVDPSGMMHMVRQEEDGDKFSLYYKKIDTEALNFSGADVRILEGNSPLQNPNIFSGKGFHCCWVQDGKVMASHADQSGNHWDAPKEITDQSPQPYTHIYKTLDGQTLAVLELGDGFPRLEWSVRKMYMNGQDISEKQRKDVRDVGREELSSQKIYQPETSVLQDLRELNEKVDKATARMDEFYTALYQLQDYIRQKDKSFFQIDAQIRKLSFEIDQLRSARGSVRTRTSSHVPVPEEDRKIPIRSVPDESVNGGVKAGSISEVDQSGNVSASGDIGTNDEQVNADHAKVSPRRNIDHGSGEIQLGSVSIRINPEEEQE